MTSNLSLQNKASHDMNKDLMEKGMKIFVQHYFSMEWIHQYTIERVFQIFLEESDSRVNNIAIDLIAVVKIVVEIYPTAKTILLMLSLLEAMMENQQADPEESRTMSLILSFVNALGGKEMEPYSPEVNHALQEVRYFTHCMKKAEVAADKKLKKLWKKAAFSPNPLATVQTDPTAAIHYAAARYAEAERRKERELTLFWEITRKKLKYLTSELTFPFIEQDIAERKRLDTAMYDQDTAAFYIHQAEKWDTINPEIATLWRRLAEELPYLLRHHRYRLFLAVKCLEKLHENNYIVLWRYASRGFEASVRLKEDTTEPEDEDFKLQCFKMSRSFVRTAKVFHDLYKKFLSQRMQYLSLQQTQSMNTKNKKEEDITSLAVSYYDDLIESVQNFYQSVEAEDLTSDMLVLQNQVNYIDFANHKFDAAFTYITTLLQSTSTQMKELIDTVSVDSLPHNNHHREEEEEEEFGYDYSSLIRKVEDLLAQYQADCWKYVNFIQLKLREYWDTPIVHTANVSNLEEGGTMIPLFKSEEQTIWRKSALAMKDLVHYAEKLVAYKQALLQKNNPTIDRLQKHYKLAVKKLRDCIIERLSIFPANNPQRVDETDNHFQLLESASILFPLFTEENELVVRLFELCETFLTETDIVGRNDATQTLFKVTAVIKKDGSEFSSRMTSLLRHVIVAFEGLIHCSLNEEFDPILSGYYSKALDAVINILDERKTSDDGRNLSEMNDDHTIIIAYLQAAQYYQDEELHLAELEVKKARLSSVSVKDSSVQGMEAAKTMSSFVLKKLTEDQREYWAEIIELILMTLQEEAERRSKHLPYFSYETKQKWKIANKSIEALVAWTNENQQLYLSLRAEASKFLEAITPKQPIVTKAQEVSNSLSTSPAPTPSSSLVQARPRLTIPSQYEQLPEAKDQSWSPFRYIHYQLKRFDLYLRQHFFRIIFYTFVLIILLGIGSLIYITVSIPITILKWIFSIFFYFFFSK